MYLVLKLNDQLKETKRELDTLTQSKKNDMATTSTNVIPTISTTVPSTVVASLAPITPPAITLPVTTKSTRTIGAQGEKAKKLVKSMEEMSIKATEMKRLKEKVVSLETDYKLSQLKQNKEAQKAQRMSERIKVLEKDLTPEKPLGKTKEMLWANIIESINDIWPSIQVIFEQTKLIKLVTEAIQKVKEELGDKPKDANRLIHFLNNKNRYELHEMNIEDRSGTIFEIRKLLSKRNLMLSLEQKYQNMQVAIDRFMAKFKILREKGLPSPMVINGKLMP